MADLDALIRGEKNPPVNPIKRQFAIHRKLIETVEGLYVAGDITDKVVNLFRQAFWPAVTIFGEWAYDAMLTSNEGVPVQKAYERLAAAGVLEKGLDLASAERELEMVFRYRLNISRRGYYEGHIISLPDGTRALKAERKEYPKSKKRQ